MKRLLSHGVMGKKDMCQLKRGVAGDHWILVKKVLMIAVEGRKYEGLSTLRSNQRDGRLAAGIVFAAIVMTTYTTTGRMGGEVLGKREGVASMLKMRTESHHL